MCFRRLSSLEDLVKDPELDLNKFKENPDISTLKRWLSRGTGLSKFKYGFIPCSMEISVTADVENHIGSLELSTTSEKIRCMLGLIPEVDIPHIRRGVEDYELKANNCIQEFCDKTGLILTEVQHLRKQGRMKVKFKLTAAGLLEKRNHLITWRFSRAYIVKDKQDYSKRLVEILWNEIENMDYMIHENVQKSLKNFLHKLVQDCFLGLSEEFSFANGRNKKIYLIGPPGVGKSRFVAIFGKALQQVLQNWIKPTAKVDIVKIPLNSGSISSLRKMLRIKGISDWSVERMIEQSLVKGDVCLLHLEEFPYEQSSQTDIFLLVESMVEHLLQKYPERRGSIFYFISSNYLPMITLKDTIVIKMIAPAFEQKKTWSYRKIRNLVAQRHNINVMLEIAEVAFPQEQHDMRLWNSWWLSIAFGLCQGICFSLNLPMDKAQYQLKCKILRDDTRMKITFKILPDNKSKVFMPQILNSSDGNFFYHEKSARMSTLFDMVAEDVLSPGVVMGGSFELFRKILIEWSVSKSIHLCEKMVTVLTLADRESLYGHQSQIKGGILGFIDDCNNPNVKQAQVTCHQCISTCTGDSDTRIVAIYVRMNEIGQFMLREILEDSKHSRNHRICISKARVIFILKLEDGAKLTPQIKSRIHLFL